MINYKQLRDLTRQERGKSIREQNYAGLIFSICLLMALIGALMAILASTTAHADNSVDIGIIARIESDNNPHAYNKHSGAIGICQITPIVLREYNHKFHENHRRNELYIKEFNLTVADWYMNDRIPQMLSIYGIEDNIRNRLIAYNWGIGHLSHNTFLPQETINYINNYEQLFKGG